MGYDMEITVFKRKTLEELYKILPSCASFRDIYLGCLCTNLYPDEFEIPEDEQGRWITSTNINIFKDFFEPKLGNDSVRIITEDIYNEMIVWLGKKLKGMTLYDVAITEDSMYKFEEMIKVYRQMKKEKIDFETEFIVYKHDW